jgi:hypothetical protein
MPTKKKKLPIAGIAAGTAAAAAAAGAAYYFYGSKHAKQHRSNAAKWAGHLKRDVMREVKKLKKIDDVAVRRLVDHAVETYKGGKVTAEELRAAATELKRNWKKLRTEAKSIPKRAAKKKTIKKRSR